MRDENFFKDHIVKEVHLKEGDYNLDVWHIKHPEYQQMFGLKFINSCGTMTVTGDYGNWVFCREFHPSADGVVSRSYWDEKLQICSEQEASKFDSDFTLELIEELEKDLNESGMYDECVEWMQDLKNSVYDELDYTQLLYRECPIDMDYEYLPFGKKRHIWLEIVYDAFNELCKRIKDEKTT